MKTLIKTAASAAVIAAVSGCSTMSGGSDSAVGTAAAGGGDASVLPAGAKAGECYARVQTPATFKTMTEKVKVSEGTVKVVTTQPKMQRTSKKVLVREEYKKAMIQPATYKTVTEKVLHEPERTKIVTVKPAQYKTVSEKIKISDAYTTWKKGTGPIQKIDHATGEIMCLVEVPAKYKTVTRKELVSPPVTKEVKIPATYQTVTKRVVATPEKITYKTIPAQYKTVHSHTTTPGTVREVKTGPKYQTVTKRMKVSDGSTKWAPILCKTNTRGGVVKKLQSALKAKGYNPGPIDGVVGRQTMAAVQKYQAANKLASGQLTIETLKHIGAM